MIFGLNALPTILLMPVAGVLVERMDKRRVMVYTDLGRAVLVAGIAALYAFGLAQAWVLACTTLLMSTFEAFRIPAGMAIYPHIVPREKYTAATALSQTANSVAVLLGTGAFGFVTALFGLQGAMAVNAVTFCISAALIWRMRLAKHEKQAEPRAFVPFFRDLRDGFSYFYGKKCLMLICVVGSGISALFVPLTSFAVAAGAVYVRSEMIFIVCGGLAVLLFLLLARSKLFREIEQNKQEVAVP